MQEKLSATALDAQCRINYGSGGSPEPGPLNSGGLIISQAEGADKEGFK